jgi:hypothetical protein
METHRKEKEANHIHTPTEKKHPTSRTLGKKTTKKKSNFLQNT